MAGGHNRTAIPLRYQIALLVRDLRTKQTWIKIGLDEDHFAEAVDFANRFSEGRWYEIYDRHQKKIVATYKTHGKRKGQDGQS